MKFTKLQIPDIILIEPLVYDDDRGYFNETYKQNELDEYLGRSLNFC